MKSQLSHFYQIQIRVINQKKNENTDIGEDPRLYVRQDDKIVFQLHVEDYGSN